MANVRKGGTASAFTALLVCAEQKWPRGSPFRTLGRVAERVVGVIGNGRLVESIGEELSKAGVEERSVSSRYVERDIEGLSALIVASNDDAENVDTALRAHFRDPSLPIVVRVFDSVLEEYLLQTAPNMAVVSMSAVGAPAVVEALGTLPVQPHAFVPPRVSGLSVGPLLRAVLLALAITTGVSTVFFAWGMKLSWVDSFYFVVTTITTTGYGDISPMHAPRVVKLADVLLMALGASLMTLFFASLTDRVFARRQELEQGRVKSRFHNHVVIVGAGNMAIRAASLLRAKGSYVIVVDKDPDVRTLERLRRDHHHVIVGDGSRETSLALSAIERASAALVLTDSDAHNLHIALLCRKANPTARIVARIDSPALSAHITQSSEFLAVSPVGLAARAFVACADL